MQFNIKPDNSGFVWLHRIIDIILPPVLLYLTVVSIANIDWHDRYTIMGTLGGFIFVTAAQMVGTYRNWRGRPFFNSVILILKAWTLTWLILILISFLYKDTANLSRLTVIIWALVTPAILISYRLAIRILLGYYRLQGRNCRTIAIVGAGKIGQHLAQTIKETPWLGYRVIGFYDDNPKILNTNINEIPVLGTIDQAIKDAQNHQFNELYICLPLRTELKIKSLLNQLTNSTVVVKYIPNLFSFDLMHAQWINLKGIPVISVFDSPLNSTTALLIKRIEDIALSSIILLLISPVMLTLAIGVKLSSPGPILYRQSRIGWNGENFNMLKFRSMPVDVEKNNVHWGCAKDKTNTKFGRFIRSTSLDELPQFLNVLNGDMSIVGPRPERDVFVEQFRKEIPRYMQKHMVKAGITGWAQIHGWRGDTSLEKRIEYDLHYINNWSLWLDIKIIVLTIFKGFINKNAY
ncbi:undecaprenyl-phosphate glucose phosphotransferase [Thiomicrorhabdus sediminis]|uniref:Undecaprenyl-phosphate glucose phosphotransferase n=1 Tax=Thiomicrorhabdus sediminis TaxID=2580412 RepID=A0A4P9K3T5_9GAMM|nr:undecaprenyl-phosphate glucose phosphotransferase [Thiomicrorhabdus sediminis]QCU89549.1 undecaprenyl-phosphate glucose phosphotransferase [Thiomicrorhabdus sediminis]